MSAGRTDPGRARDRVLASPWLMLAVVALAVALLAGFGERIRENEGLGYDGIVYAQLMDGSPLAVCRRGVTDYYLQRVVPPFLVRTGLVLAGVPLSIPTIVRGFLVYQCILIVVAAGCLLAVAQRFGFGTGDRWLLLLVALANYGLAKQTFYGPVLTDVSGFALGCGMLYAWVAGRFALLLGLTVVGTFAWPAVLVGGACLLAFPRAPDRDTAALRDRLMWPVVLAVVGGYLALFCKLYVVDGIVDFNQLFKMFQSHTQFIRTWRAGVWLSVAAVVVVLATMVRSAGVSLAVLRAALPRVSRPGLAAAAAVIVLRSVVLWSCATSTGEEHHLRILNGIVLLPVARPFLFVTSFAAFYGLAAVLLIVFWRELWAVLREEALGLRLWILFGLLLNLDCEARKSIHSFPALAFFLVEAVRRAGSVRTAGGWAAVLVVAAVSSKVWLRINVAPMTGRYTDFPDQLYFMNYGAWMSDLAYGAQSAVLAVGVVALWWTLKTARGSEARRSED